MKVVVVGAGVIGLSIAWRVARHGDDVVVVDPDPGRGASWVAGGMLAPSAEAAPGEDDLAAFGVASARRWPSWVDELREAGDLDPGYTQRGTLVVARDADELAGLQPLRIVQERFGLAAEAVTSREARRHEPALTPTIRGGLWLADDHQVDNRAYVAALLAACDRTGVLLDRRAASLVTPTAVSCTEGPAIGADRVVVATGAWQVPVEVEGSPVHLPVRPVKGQIVRVRATSQAVFPTRTVRADDVYVIPRSHGEIAIGATSEERGFDTTVTAGGIRELLQRAWELLPGLAEATFVEAIAGLRPATPDNAPIIGSLSPDGPLVATGHYRHGLLFSPGTAEAVDAALHGEPEPATVLPFAPGRFAGAGGMNVHVNGSVETVGDGLTVAELVDARLDSPKGVAVALNAEVVPRSSWRTTPLRDGDQVELLTAAQGG